METKISRRDFLQYGAGAIAGLGLGAGGLWLFNDYLERNQTLANKLLEEFPNQIPGSRSVEKQKVRGANKILVHVRQGHNNRDISQEEIDYVVSVQTDMHSILEYLNTNQGITEVYSEGEFGGKMEYLLQHPEQIDLTNINPSLDERYLLGAEYMLSENGKINVLSAETMEDNFAAQDAFRSYKKGLITLEARDRLVFDAREDVALDIISKNPNQMNVMVYGGAHKFEDNIHEWNQRNPDKKYSLIEVTPESYRSKE